MTNQPQDKMRADFEAWAEHSFYSGMDSPELDWSDESNSYKTLAHHMAFCAWQAAQSQQDALAPLTDARICDIADDYSSTYQHGGSTYDQFDHMGFARAIESEHGITANAAAAPIQAQEDARELTIRFYSVKESLPDAKHYSSSYGGQWSSDYCVVIDVNGRVSTRRMVVSGSVKEEIEAGRRPLSHWFAAERQIVAAWAYCADINTALAAARASNGGKV